MTVRCSFPNRRVFPGIGVIMCLVALVGCGGGGASSGSGGGGGSTAGTLEHSSPTALFVDGGIFSVNRTDSLNLSYTVANNKLNGSGMFSGPGMLSAMALSGNVAFDGSILGSLTAISGETVSLTGNWDGTTLTLNAVYGSDLGSIPFGTAQTYKPLLLRSTYTGSLNTMSGSLPATLHVTSQSLGLLKGTFTITSQGSPVTYQAQGTTQNPSASVNGSVTWSLIHTNGSSSEGGVMQLSTQGNGEWVGDCNVFINGTAVDANTVITG